MVTPSCIKMHPGKMIIKEVTLLGNGLEAQIVEIGYVMKLRLITAELL